MVRMLWNIIISNETRATINARYDLARMKKNYDDSNWREESIPYHTGKQLELLMDGPKSLSQSWMMSALHNKWKKMKGYKDPSPPDVSSSMKEFFQRQKDQGI